jgi:MATE family multidrug resistance protein
MTRPSREDFRALAALALPIVVVQVGQMLMGVVDAMMVGHFSSRDLAAVALGTLYFFGTCVVGFGLTMAIDPIVSQAVGARDEAGIARGVQRGLLLSVGIAVPSSLLLIPGELVLRALGQPEEVIPVAAEYVRASIPGVLPFFAYNILRIHLQAVGGIRPLIETTLAANAVHIPLNLLLIFGGWGVPAMGAVGAGWATSISRWFMLVLLVAAGWKVLRPALHPLRREIFNFGPFLRVVRIGLPIGLQFFIEFSVFGAVGLLIGTFGEQALSAHMIALNLASFTFMVPLGISLAGAVLVGRGVGAGDMTAARRAATAAMAGAAGFMSITAVLFLVFPGLLSAAYTRDPAVALLAVTLLRLAGVFQVFDGLQVVFAGVLRGMGQTRAPLWMNLCGFWIFGFPAGLVLAYGLDQGAPGLWWGLVVGLACVAMGLFLAAIRHLKRDVARVVIDEPVSEPT